MPTGTSSQKRTVDTGRLTKLPLPLTFSIRPAWCKPASAWRTVMQLTANSAIKSASDGNLVPGPN